MKFEDSWENNTHQDVEDAIKDKVEEIAGRIDDVEESVPDAEDIEAIRQAAQDAQDAAAAVGDIINGNSGRVSHAKAPAVVLRYIHQNDGTNDMSLDDLNAGDVYADAGGSLELVVIENGSKTVKNIGTIDKGLIFYSIREEGFFRYLGSAAWELLSQGGGEEQEGTFAELDVDSRLKHIQSPVMALDCISQSEEPGIADCPIGGYYCYMGNQASACRIRYRKAKVTAGQYEDIDLSSPQGHVLYYNKAEDKTYNWDGQKLVAVLWHAGLAIDNRLMSSRATAVVLWYISANLDDGETPIGANSGDVYCDSNNHIIVRGGTVNPDKEYVTAASLPTTPDADLGLPDQKLVYYDVNKKGFYRWNGAEWKKALDIDIDTTNLVTIKQLNDTLSSYATKSYVEQAVQQAEQGETVVINSDGANIVDEHDNNSVLFAPSARQMKLMYDNFMAVYNSLASIAFINGKPSLDWIGTKTKYTLSYGTLTGCTADVAAGQVNEGGLRIKLTPAQSSYAFTSVTVNGESVSTMATGDADGSVYIDIIVNGNITVAATAISGRAINFNGTGCSIGAAGVAIGQDLDTTITANEHFTLPESITVKIGNTNVTHRYTRAQGNKTATLYIDAANITGDLAITCTADEDNHAVLTFGQLSNVTIKSGTRQLESGSHIYDGDTISIKPTNGYKLTGKPIFTNDSTTPIALNPTTESGDIYNGYDFGFNPLPNRTIVITNVGATELNHTLRASLTGTGGESVDSSTDLSSNITEGSAWSTVLSVKSTAEEGTAITSVSPSMEGGGPISYDANTKRVHTDCVTGNITITVAVTGVVKRTITLPTNEHVIVKADDNSTILKASDNTNPTNPQVTDGGAFECYLAEDPITDTTNEIHYDIVDVSVKLGNNVVANAFDPLTGKVTIQNVDDNVTIEVKTLSFVGSCIIDASGNQVNRVNTHTYCATNEFIDIPAGTARIVYDSGLKISEGNIAIYDESGTMTKYKSCANRYNWIDVDSTDKKLKMTFGCSAKNDASIRKGRYIVCLDSNYDFIGYAYKGIDYDGYYENESIQGVTNKILYCARLNSNTAGIEQFTTYDDGVCATRLIPVADNIPDGVTAVEFSCNGTRSTADRFGTYTSSTAKPSVTNMDSAGTPKSVSISGKTHIALSANDIDHSFIRYTYNGEYVYLFKGLYVVEETLTNEE